MRRVSYLLAILVFAVAPAVTLGADCDLAEPPGRQEDTHRDRGEHEPVQTNIKRIAPPVRENVGVPAKDAVGESRVLRGGRMRKNLGEVPANVPGYEKVRIVEDTAEPGATWKATMRVPMFCTVMKGEITYVAKDGTKTVYKAGDSYVCCDAEASSSQSRR